MLKYASKADIEHLRKQEFNTVNGLCKNDFWRFFDDGIFCYHAVYYDISDGDIPEKENWSSSIDAILQKREVPAKAAGKNHSSKS